MTSIKIKSLGAFVISVLYLASGGGVMIGAVPPQAHVPPLKEHAGTEIIGLGDLLPGILVSRSVGIHNGHAGPLRITRAITSCGCTQARLSRKLIPAGASATLNFRVAIRPWAGTEQVAILVAGTWGKRIPWRREVLVRYHARRMLRISLKGREALESQDYLNLGTLRGHAAEN